MSQVLGPYTYAARLSASSWRSQLNNGFQLVKIWAASSTSLVPKETANRKPQSDGESFISLFANRFEQGM